MAEASEWVFIYGTLRSGCGHAFRMVGGRLVRRGQVRGRLYRVGSYPALVVDEQVWSWVKGELWKVPRELFEEIDDHETNVTAGHGAAAFVRRRVEVEMMGSHPGLDLEAQEAWVWEWDGGLAGAHEVVSGDWIDEEFGRRPPIFSVLGLIAFPTMAIGASTIYHDLVATLGGWASGTLQVFGMFALTLMTPAVAFGFSWVGEKLRERGHRLRAVTTVLALLWVGCGFMLLMLWVIEGRPF